MTPDQHLAAVTADSQAFAELAAPILDTEMDLLDGWTVAELVAHLGAVYAMVTANVEAAGTEPTAAGPEATAPAEGLLDWFIERRARVLAALGEADPAAPCWTFPGVGDADWWRRRMAHETAIHLWDLRATVDSPETAEPPDGDHGADGVAEYLAVGLRFSSSRPNRIYPDRSLHLHRTDGPGEWMLTRGGTETEVVVTEEHGKGDAAVRGHGGSLLLWVWGRPAGGIEIFGDESVATQWQALAP